jgi:hypothetical protein
VMTMTKLSTTNESEESLDLQRRGVQKIKTRTNTQRDWHWLSSGSPEVKEAAGQIWIIPLMHPEVSLYDGVKAFLFFMSPSLQ